MLVAQRKETDKSQPKLQEEEELLQTFTEVEAWIGKARQGAGTLWVTNRHMYWLHNSHDGVGAKVHFERITLHALSHATDEEDGSAGSGFSRECVYCQLDQGWTQLGDDDEEDHPVSTTATHDPDGDDVESMLAIAAELRLFHPNKQVLQEIYAAFDRSALLNPCPEEEDEGDFYHCADNKSDDNDNTHHDDHEAEETPNKPDEQTDNATENSDVPDPKRRKTT
eukprot:TRINITY_DN67787_c5_g6_i1.p1 TRINITY_DN67787_c5_g6~~TRINITY_DN67787_c5_g6_i1.p1  ORF type:complete len:224 (+),score=44.65 TRINITY_DN67787_c5_g6_i1:33-704(+)